VRRDKPRQSSAQGSPRLARAKGDLVVTHADGTIERIPAREATRAAREALASASAPTDPPRRGKLRRGRYAG